MKRIIDFQTYLGDMFHEARCITFKKPLQQEAYDDPLAVFENEGFISAPEADTDLTNAMQKRMWAKGNLFSAAEAMDANAISYFFLLPVYPNTSFDEMRGAATLDARFVPFTSPDFSLFTAQMLTTLKRDFTNGAKGLHLHAALQNIDLANDQVNAAVTLAGTQGLPVVVYYGAPLHYPQSPLFPIGTKPANTALDKVLALVQKFPGFKFVLTGGPTDHADTARLADMADDCSNVYVTTAYQNVTSLQNLLQKFGADRILFGSAYPFACPAVGLAQCEKAFSGKDLRKIMYQNAVNLVNLYA